MVRCLRLAGVGHAAGLWCAPSEPEPGLSFLKAPLSTKSKNLNATIFLTVTFRLLVTGFSVFTAYPWCDECLRVETLSVGWCESDSNAVRQCQIYNSKIIKYKKFNQRLHMGTNKLYNIQSTIQLSTSVRKWSPICHNNLISLPIFKEICKFHWANEAAIY